MPRRITTKRPAAIPAPIDVVHPRKAKTGARGRRLIGRLRGRGDVKMTTEEILALAMSLRGSFHGRMRPHRSHRAMTASASSIENERISMLPPGTKRLALAITSERRSIA